MDSRGDRHSNWTGVSDFVGFDASAARLECSHGFGRGIGFGSSVYFCRNRDMREQVRSSRSYSCFWKHGKLPRIKSRIRPAVSLAERIALQAAVEPLALVVELEIASELEDECLMRALQHLETLRVPIRLLRDGRGHNGIYSLFLLD